MSLLVFSDNPGVEETKMVLSELKRRQIPTDFLTPWDISLPDMDIKEYQVVYVPSNMLHRGSTFEFIHRLEILRRFEEKSRIINPLDSILSYSKENLTLTLKKNKFPHPRTLITENHENAKRFSIELLEGGREVIMKPICRARGIGVRKLSNIWKREQLNQFLVWYSRKLGQGVYYLQEFIPNQGYDIRCLVVDGVVVGREKRSNPEDFRYNVAAGGIAEPFEDDTYDDLAREVAHLINLDITGLDILPGKDGTPYVLEANAYPGYKTLIEATGAPIHKYIVDYLERQL
ncbi:MAG: RimK family alpha-L-glutamate ligase [Candidatus Bathyarchaeia archaeon]